MQNFTSLKVTALLALPGALAIAFALRPESAPAAGAQLPVPCIAGTCGTTTKWVGAGTATATQSANTLTVNQTSSSAILNWQSFNISANGTVNFKQPNASSIALNQIFQADPSKIMGALNANGGIYLINQNGIIFGAGSQVNVHTLLASSLNITPQAINGLLNAAQQFAPALSSFTDAQGNPLPSGDISVQAGATIQAPGGQVMLFGPNVTNAGTIHADGGQVILAAGNQVYLAASSDPNLRGLLVEVGGTGGTATNAAASGNASGGQITANLGDITMAGHIVNQFGRLSATTSVVENGSIHLLAEDGGTVSGVTPAGAALTATNGGTLTLGPGSHTDVLLDTADTGLAVDSAAQPQSQVVLHGTQVVLNSGSEITATHGVVTAIAANNPDDSVINYSPQPGNGRLVIESGANIDVSGANVQEPVSDNIIAVQLRGTELADSPLQRNGPLRGQTVFVDVRDTGTFDGTTWVGSPIGDLSGYVATIQRSVAERSLTGGKITLQSDGAVLAYAGSTLNESGGSIQFLGGQVNTTKLLGTDGKIYDISQALPNMTYVGAVNTATVSNSKWGTSQTFQSSFGSHYEAGYVEGKDAGSISVVAPSVVLDGTLAANTVIGPNQRQLPTALPTVNAPLYRPADEIPLGGELTVGFSGDSVIGGFLISDVTFAPGNVLNALTGPTGEPFNPLTDPLPASLSQVQLNPALVGPNGVSQLEIFANGHVSIPNGVDLQFPIAGGLSVTAGAVDIEGSVRAPSGSISVSAAPTVTLLPGATDAKLTLGSSATLDVSGYVVNDLPAGTSVPRTDPLAIAGGSVTLGASGGAALNLQSGSVIDVSAGAQLTSAGQVNAGSGGSITIKAGTDAGFDPVPASFDSTLRGFALQNGGSLSIEANSICIAAADCTMGQVGSLWVAPSLFTADGFSSVSLTSNVGGLTVLPGTELNPRQLNYQLSTIPSSELTGTSLAAIAPVALTPDLLRNPENVSLTTTVAGFPSTIDPIITADNILTIGHGAAINLDPQGKLTIASNTSVIIDGALNAPAGTINVSTTTSLPLLAFLPNQGIWLEDGAQLSAPGVALLQVNDQGLTTGSVLGGGNIAITANRGYLITTPNSSIDASGTAASLDLVQPQPNGKSSPVNTLIGSSGGTISLTASEGMLLNGAVTAKAGAGPGAAGGTLNVTFDGTLHDDPGTPGDPFLPANPHQLMISNSLPFVIVAPGHAVPDSLNGVAMLPAQTINNGGFSTVDLTVPNVFGPQEAAIAAFGSIVFPTSVALNVVGSLRLNAPQIVGGAGAQVNLASAYVGLGYDDTRAGTQVGEASAGGTGSLKVNGDLIELIGGLGLSGFQSTSLTSTGDIRLRGVQPAANTAQPLAESLQTQGTLTLQAAQIYPTTLTQASVVVGGDNSEIDILRGGSGGPVLSAAGQLTLQADSISQGGVVVAPFGQITLAANSLTLAPGSLTSTSGAGQVIPFGTTEAGTDWVYTLPQSQTLVYTASGPPAKSISLQGNSVNVAAGATIDVSGGGDMQAYEFIPGTGGTQDVLANSFNPTQFAIVPASGLTFAPYDPQASAAFSSQTPTGFSYAIGSSVVLGAGNGVPAGTYAILPARYALLPGAYLVTPMSGFGNLAPGQTIAQADGSVIVSGRFAQAGTNIVQPLSQGFDIESLSQVMAQAQYNLTSANAFFTAAATANNAQPPALPRDAGTLQFQAGQQLQFLGTLADAPAAGGRGGLVDISATQIEIANGTSPVTAGVVTLDAAQLNALNAQSLLIGGIRSTGTSTSNNGVTESVTNIQTTASSVSVDPNVKLIGSDVILAATDSITLGSGATLQATGTAVSVPSEYDLTGGGALLRVSTGPQVSIVRTALDGASGAMTLSAGSSLAATGSATLDATGNLTSAATYSVQHGSLAFSAPQITLGATTQSGNALNLSPTELSSLDLAALMLSSATSIDVYGTDSLAIAGNLTLNAPLIEAATPSASLSLQANTVTLNGSSATPTPAPMSSSGNFAVQASTLSLGGAISLQGFAATALDGENAIVAQSSGSFATSGPLTLNTALLTGSNAVNYQFTSPGAVHVLGPSAAGSAPTNVAGAGATLSLSGSSIDIATRVASASGTLQLTATGPAATDGVMLDSGATVDLSGSAVTFDGVTAYGPGGRVLVSSMAGGFTEAAGASIDLSAGGAIGAAGTLSVSVPQGTASFLGSLSANGASGGNFLLDAMQLPDLGALNVALNAGGFTGARGFRQQGLGDVIVPSIAGGTVRASTVSIEADGGSVDVQGVIDASGAIGGSVSLYGQNAVTIEGTILASATQAGQNGGSLQIASGNGQIQFANSAAVDLSASTGGTNGSIALQAPRSSLTDSGNPGIALNGSFRGVQQVQVEGLASYQSSGTITVADQAGYYADAVAFMQNAPAIGQAVAGSSHLSVSVVPGVEVSSQGDLTLAKDNDWDLSTWQFNGVTVPGILTLRAGGNLIFSASLSDGFSGTTGASAFVLPGTPAPSWSYRLVAGADLGASDLMAVLSSSALASGEGNLMIAAGKIDGGTSTRPPTPIMVRTGTGDINIVAAGNLEFGNQASVIYTAGEASNLGVPLAGLSNLAYPTAGGNISINVGGDILGAPTNQLVTSWLWRTGVGSVQSKPTATGWTVNYLWFEENIGALAGGNVNIAAGGDVSELSVAIANIGVPSASAPGSSVTQMGGGALNVSSGGNITGGSYFVGSGSANLFASGLFGEDLSTRPTATGLAPILALGDAVMNVSAIGDVQIETALNPFLLPQGKAQGVVATAQSSFSTYTDNSTVNLTSVAGDATLLNDPTRVIPKLTSISFPGGSSQIFTALPGTLDMTALAGNVNIDGAVPIALWPAPRGNLELLADVNVEFSTGATLLMSDEDPATLPSTSAPVNKLSNDLAWAGLFVAPVSGISHLPIHSAAFGSGTEDPVPVRVVALTGDISDANLGYIAKPIDVIAGKDITELNLQVEQLSASDLSVISAGGNFTDATLRNSTSGAQLADTSHGVTVEGPGSLLLSAGGNINFGASNGITSAGNLFNPANAAGGADVTVMAGASVSQADIAAFTAQYLASESTYDTQLIAFVSAQTNQPVTSKAQALQAFATLSQAQQFELSEQILFDELRTGGEAAAAAGPLHNNYTSAFTALSTLFPHSTSSDSATGAAATYPGSISMYFSRVYTLDGGNISLLAPGGFVNVGISTPPASFGIVKTPDQLGVVAQQTGNVTSVSFGDFEVNESRVFAADGGNILVWSTDGNIDAGRGAKTAISAPAPTITISPDGTVQTTFPTALTGSGIQALATTTGVSPGNVDLFAPQGVVNANDAGIVAGNLTIGATAVLGRDNITVSGVAVGLPPDTSGLGASLASSSSAAASATSAAETLGASGANNADKAAAPLSENALSWLDVFVTGLGEENCKPDDIDCLKRQKAH